MSWKNPFVFIVVMTLLCLLTTMFIRVPLPSRGYFNFGDVAVVFSGLMAGKHLTGTSKWSGTLAGGVGSAIADVVGGYAMFAPITLVAKCLEAAMATFASTAKPLLSLLFLTVGAVLMVGVYFIGEWLMPSLGIAGALSELPANVIQAVGGLVGGYILFRALDLIIRAGEMPDA
ncbi:MAG TPA: ECF transporter S component [Allosphingosinicella sp.]|nr:ECF transporter S component [Allosphingosinicella sp.]